MEKEYKITTITKGVDANMGEPKDWIDSGSILNYYLQNGWAIQQMTTTSTSENQISLTVLLSKDKER